MRHEEQVRVIRTLMRHLDNGTNVDEGAIRKISVADYTSPERAALEWNAFFREHPQVIGMSGDLPKPGSFLTSNDFGVPLLATRAADGRFRAFGARSWKRRRGGSGRASSARSTPGPLIIPAR